MPEYKKKKHSRIFSSPKKPKRNRRVKTDDYDEIKMSPEKEVKIKSVAQSNMKVVKGRKLEQRKKALISAIIISCVLIFLLVFQLIFPAGLFESVTNSISVFGSGSYPIELESTETINALSRGSYYYVLTNSHISAYTNAGKELFSYSHGFEKPIIKTSSTRALVFNQGGVSALIFNNNGLKETLTTENEILCGGISDSGTYALATISDEYASAVSVYNKQNKLIYEWFSAENTVNNVAISPNGKKIAVSAFSSSVGKYVSTLSVLNYKSATPEFYEKLEGTLVYNIDTFSSNYFAMVSTNKIKFFKWSNLKSVEHANDYNLSFYKSGKGGSVAVFNRESDKTDNKIEIYSKSGQKKAEFNFKGIISDIQLFGNHIYCMSETDIYLLSSDGKVLRKTSCGFGAIRLVVTGTNTVCVITDNEIEKYKLESEETKWALQLIWF